jgi:predicted ferric reductase
MNFLTRGLFWGSFYVVLIIAPLFFLLIKPAPVGSGFWWDFSAACGFVSATIIATMFVLTARFKQASAPFGIDLIYYVHRLIALVATGFLLMHPIALLIADPRIVFFVRPNASPYHLEAGIGSFVCFVVIMMTSLWRKRLHLEYDVWRRIHVFFALLAVILALIHIQGVGHYVNTFANTALWVLITLSCLVLFLYVRLCKPLWLKAHPYRVVGLVREDGDAWTLTVKPDGHAGFQFMPGQFAWLTLWSTPFAMKEHPFSIASSAEADEMSFTIKELGDFTRKIHEVEIGQVAYVDAPYGAFSTDRLPANGYVFVAGGIGIAPIMSMLRTLADRGDERSLLLIYAYNTWEGMTFRDEITELQQRLHLEVVFVLKRPPSGWTGESGVLSRDILERHITNAYQSFEFLICGPVAMLEVAERALNGMDIPLMNIHSELFDLV